MANSGAVEELRLLIKSRHPILYVESHEEERLEQLLGAVSNELERTLFVWSVTRGLCRHLVETPVYETQDPAKVLGHIRAARVPAIYLLRDFHPYLKEPGLIRTLRELAQESEPLKVTLVLSAPSLELPPDLRKLAARYELKLPSEDELRRAVIDTFRDLNQNEEFQYRLDPSQLTKLVRNLKGLTLSEVRRAISRCVFDDNILDASDLPQALEAKRERIEQSGFLEFIEVGEEMASLGGLHSFKGWLKRFQAGFSERARKMGLRPPRGVMLVGVQGCGKSLAAKTIAREWSLPLLRLEAGRLLDKFVGESEKNLRNTFDLAEATAPVILWIDEIEKAFAGSSSSDADAGLGRRMFGSFLTWMQEKKETVFVAATANDLSKTPPELLRKGRFDEIFFVDLPDAQERREMFSIHLKMRRQDSHSFDVDALVEASDGFSGAEIEQVVVTSLYGVLAENAAQLTTEHLVAELGNTVPLSRSRREYVNNLREMARERFVPAR